MKKIQICIFMMILSTLVFAREAKSYITVAYNYGLFTERAEKAQTKISSNGIDLSISGYSENNWGVYVNTDYNFISETTVTSQGVSITATDSDWDFSMILSAILGPSYKYNVNESFELFTALGFHFAQYSLNSKYVGSLSYSFGIGGDIGVRYLPTKNFYLTGGCLMSHDFYNNSETKTANGSIKGSGSYNLGSFRPYIGIGVSFTEIIK